MRIIQITDSHVGEAGECPYDIKLRDNFINILSAIKSTDADIIVHTGDLCLKEPKESIYQWIKQQIIEADIKSPIRFIPGNHDDVLMMQQELDLKYHLKESHSIYYSESLSDHRLIYLDTSVKSVSASQLAWLDELLQKAQHHNVVIFMHHPPLEAHVPYMDRNHKLQNMDEFTEILYSHHDKHFDIFCGHYHIEKSIHTKNVAVHITPSSYIQIDQDSIDFRVDHKHPGYRIIDICITSTGYRLDSFVRYIY